MLMFCFHSVELHKTSWKSFQKWVRAAENGFHLMFSPPNSTVNQMQIKVLFVPGFLLAHSHIWGSVGLMVREASICPKDCRIKPPTGRLNAGGESERDCHTYSTSEQGPWARPLTLIAPVELQWGLLLVLFSFQVWMWPGRPWKRELPLSGTRTPTPTPLLC